MVEEIAPAKINLYLHVGGLRRDRLHDLRSLFVFADGGDLVTAEPARDLSLTITGPFSPPLLREPTEKNLVMRAARALRAAAGVSGGARITLDKRLPIASGVGGGSADAAATLRALMKLWRLELDAGDLRKIAFGLGADVPACLTRAPVLVSGAGERLSRAPKLPPLAVCLVNTRVAMPTGPVFRAFDAANPAPPAPRDPPFTDISGLNAVRSLLAKTRNDLEPHAVARAPSVARAIDALSATAGALPARMSGSGATVFALFSSRITAGRAAQAMRGRGWWSMDASLYGAGAV
jgi:4-diphosphocytidyl-2-C-methyl-D-erythritol kinase